MAWTVVNAHYPAMFIGGFLFFLGFARATAVLPESHRAERHRSWSASSWPAWSSTAVCRAGGLHRCRKPLEDPLFLGSTLLTAFNDNALITYLATLVPSLNDLSRWLWSKAQWWAADSR